jgi:transitional endoplasmic reticulum ATPase
MPGNDDTIRALRRALEVSPENLPLRQHLAETLLGLGRPAEAEAEFRQALRLAPDDPYLQLGLASAFYQQGKERPALVIVEELVRRTIPDHMLQARAEVLYARLLANRGELEQAGLRYRRAIELDPSVADPVLAARLAVGVTDSLQHLALGRQAAAGDVADWEDTTGGADLAPERPTVTFADVGGMEELKEEIRMKIVYPLTRPELFRAFGKSAGGGILLYGPPGCGKTFLARATAGEIKAAFLSVEIHEVLDMWLGQSERNLHEVFDQARRNRPCVLFFDEVDALGASRSDLRQSAGRHLVNQFLAELDGVRSSNEGVLILAATNAPWALDPAFRRPGRFDRVLFVPPPDAPARAAILRALCRDKPVRDIDAAAIAARTDGFSGADLKAVVDLAIERKLREAMTTGALAPLTTRDLLDAVSAVRPSTREWFATARNYALYANPGGIYDDIRRYLKL